jgi:hypothetical protein
METQIDLAAIQIKLDCGKHKIFTGSSHFEAAIFAISDLQNIPIEKAYDLFIDRKDDNILQGMAEGFTTNTGRFLSRSEASRIAQNIPALANAMARNRRDWLDSQDFL